MDCVQCHITNFARRIKCFKCFSPKTDECELVSFGIGIWVAHAFVPAAKRHAPAPVAVLCQVTDILDFGSSKPGPRQPCAILVVRNLGNAKEAEVRPIV